MRLLPLALEPHDALMRGLLPAGGFVVLQSIHARDGKPLRWEARYFQSASVSKGEDGSFLVEGPGGEVIINASAPLPSRIISAPRRQSFRVEGHRGLDYALVFLPPGGLMESISSFLARALEFEAGMKAESASALAHETLAALRAFTG